jgi:dipeptidyl aminopeptidase/acylaminoacyl peptidase
MDPNKHDIAAHLKTVDLEGEVTDITADWGEVQSAAWLPDGQKILYTGQPAGLPIGSKNDLWITDKGGSTPECRTKDLKFGVGGGLQPDMPVMPELKPLITEDGKKAFVNVQDGGTVQIYEVNLSGKESWKSLLNGERACYPMGLAGEDLLFAVTTLNDPPELYLAETDGSEEKQLTTINQEILAEFNLPEYKHLLFPSEDGVQVEGWIMLPPEGEAPYPTVLYIHGGPHGAFGHTFSFDFQMLAGAGYAVLIVNHRASTGYGEEFSTAIKGDWGNLDYKDLMASVDYAIEKGLADPDRLGVCGLSGGGNLSCWIVGQTDRFKAAVPENPVTNWLSFYGVSDVGVWFAVEEMGGHPHEMPEVYAKCSPITFAHNCTTPTLLIQGEFDLRCPAEQSEQFYAVLKANGCVVEMLRLPNSPHTGSIMGPLPIRRAQNDALLDWMDRYVLGKTAEEEKA